MTTDDGPRPLPFPVEEDEHEHGALPDELPILPLRNAVLFPGTVLPLQIGRPRSVRLVDQALAADRHLGLVAQRDSDVEDPRAEDLYGIGCAGNVLRLLKLPDNTQSIIVQGVQRFRIDSIVQTEPYVRAKVTYLEDVEAADPEAEALLVSLQELASKVVELSPNIPSEANLVIRNLSEAGPLADFLAANLGLAMPRKQEILEELDVRRRAESVTRILQREIEVLELSGKIQQEVKESMDKSQRDFFLREQMKAIRQELGEKDERTAEIEELEKRLAESKLPEEARKEADREIKRLARMPPGAAEYTVSRTYIDWLLELPWNTFTEDHIDLRTARAILEEDHYDLEKVKKRIIEYLAVRKLRPEAKGPLLCLAGPPGVGKTSIGRSIARALGRKFVRLSLGGVRDEAEIRGHRRTYVGALPGRILQSIRKAGTANPVFMLDEIDKVGTDAIRGDPSSALLEVLDPEQNFSFSDHYLEVPFDLSKVMFIATANILEPIPPALRDRLEVLEIPGYTEEEKLGIAQKYLMPRQLTEHGLNTDRLEIGPEAIQGIIRSYTREAGVRNLEREIASICRGAARKVAESEEASADVKPLSDEQPPSDGRPAASDGKPPSDGQPPSDGRPAASDVKPPSEVKSADDGKPPSEVKSAKIVVGPDDLHEYLGPLRFFRETAERTSTPGVATGLVWTPVGGDIIFVEATAMPGRGGLVLTGYLGEVMQESAQAALSHLRTTASRYHLPDTVFSHRDIHVHVPAGAIPKDGPSAGVTIFVALTSLMLNRPVRSDVAMTGEITLRGQVLPIGGVKEKVLGASRAGITTVILPERNRKDLEDIPEPIRQKINFEFVSTADQALTIALEKPGARTRSAEGEEREPATTRDLAA